MLPPTSKNSNQHTHHPSSPIQHPTQSPTPPPTAPKPPKAHKTTSLSSPSPSSHPLSPPHRSVAGKAKAVAAETQQPPCPPQPRGQIRETPKRAAQGTWADLCSIAGAALTARRWSHGGCRLVCRCVRRSGVVGSRVGRNYFWCVSCVFCRDGVVSCCRLVRGGLVEVMDSISFLD